MLYRSTRSKLESFTTYRALRLNRGTDNGVLLPLRIPVLDASKIAEMRNAEFTQNVADMLNLFFGTDFTGWDVELTIGKSPLQMVECGQNVLLAQWWKNPSSHISYYQKCIFERLCPGEDKQPVLWVKIATRICLIAATLCHLSEKEVDIAVNVGDFEQVLAVYFCRKMGLPVRKILMACNENSNLWDFIYRGTIHCGASLQKTNYPEQDNVIPVLFEAYLFLAYGYDETQRFLRMLAQKQDYQLPEDAVLPIEDNMFASVIGQQRIPAVVNSFRSNNGLPVNPYAAFSLGVLQDYRAKAGESFPTLVFEEAAP